MKNKKRSARSYLTNNTSLKFISLLFAILLWSFVTNSTNPERTKIIEDVPIVVQGIEVLEEKGFAIRDDLTKLPTADIKVKVKNSDYRNVNKNVVLLTVDVSEISKDGTNSIAIKPNFSNLVDVTLSSIEPQQSITLTVDKIITKEVNVVLNETGTLKENLIKVNPQYSQNITVKGSSYYLDRIEKAIVDIDLSTLNDGDVLLNTPCRFVDKDDNVINFTGHKLDINMDIQTKKEVTINLTDSIVNKDKIKDGYEFISATANKVTLCGHSDVIQSLTEVTAQAIDLTDKDSTFTSVPLTLNLPEGVTILSGQETPSAKIDIKQKGHSITVSRTIIVSGLNPNLNASITSGDQTAHISADGTAQIKTTITLTGPKLILDNLKESDVIVRLSLLDKNIGTYELSPIVGLSPALANNVTAQLVSPTQVSVSISAN